MPLFFVRCRSRSLTPTDPLTFATMAGTLMIAALIAVALPARRAARLDPMAALREE
jgi:ABC-type antimicrobial peptide transport system permease subunit